jgi:hypothetical protein
VVTARLQVQKLTTRRKSADRVVGRVELPHGGEQLSLNTSVCTASDPSGGLVGEEDGFAEPSHSRGPATPLMATSRLR